MEMNYLKTLLAENVTKCVEKVYLSPERQARTIIYSMDRNVLPNESRRGRLLMTGPEMRFISRIPDSLLYQ